MIVIKHLQINQVLALNNPQKVDQPFKKKCNFQEI